MEVFEGSWEVRLGGGSRRRRAAPKSMPRPQHYRKVCRALNSQEALPFFVLTSLGEQIYILLHRLLRPCQLPPPIQPVTSDAPPLSLATPANLPVTPDTGEGSGLPDSLKGSDDKTEEETSRTTTKPVERDGRRHAKVGHGRHPSGRIHRPTATRPFPRPRDSGTPHMTTSRRAMILQSLLGLM